MPPPGSTPGPFADQRLGASRDRTTDPSQIVRPLGESGGTGGPPPPPPPGYRAYPQYHDGFTPSNPATLYGEIAGFGARLGGFVLDWLLYGAIAITTLMVGLGVLMADPEPTALDADVDSGIDDTNLVVALVAMLAGPVLVVVVYLRALASTGRTWGRRIVGIEVIDERTGLPPGWGKAIGRAAFAWFVSAQILYIGFLWALWDDNRQTLHDKVAGTHVIRSR